MADTVVWALKTGDMEVVQANLVTADDVNRVVEERSGRLPLHIAADFGQEEVMMYLIAIGADINVVDNNGFTPLICACYESHSACVKLLLEKGADKQPKATNGVCAFEAAESEEIKALLQ